MCNITNKSGFHQGLGGYVDDQGTFGSVWTQFRLLPQEREGVPRIPWAEAKDTAQHLTM